MSGDTAVVTVLPDTIKGSGAHSYSLQAGELGGPTGAATFKFKVRQPCCLITVACKRARHQNNTFAVKHPGSAISHLAQATPSKCCKPSAACRLRLSRPIPTPAAAQAPCPPSPSSPSLASWPLPPSQPWSGSTRPAATQLMRSCASLPLPSPPGPAPPTSISCTMPLSRQSLLLGRGRPLTWPKPP